MLRLILVCVSLCLLAGCGVDSGGDGAGAGGAGGGGSSVGRGSAACRGWQDALCDFAVDRCGNGTFTRAQCDNQYQGVTCNSDAAATTCTNSLKTGACAPATVAGCDVADIADPVPAQEACDEFVHRMCLRGVECSQYTTEAECAAEVAVGLNCDEVSIHTLDYEACVVEIDVLSCTATALPAVCEDVFLRVQ